MVIFAKPTKGLEKISVNITQYVEKEASIAVTDKEILKLKAKIYPSRYWLNKNKPLILRARYHNQGNVYLKPDLKLKIIQTSSGKIVHTVIYSYLENNAPIKPFEEKVFSENN